MSSVIQLSILLLLSAVFAEHGGFSIHSNMKLKLKNLALSSSSIMRDQHEGDLKIGTYAAPPKWQKNPLFCCTCQDFVTKTKPKVDSKIQLKIYKFCNMFIQNVKKTCLDKGAKLKFKILKSLFPGKTPRHTCQKAKLCLY